MDYLVILVVSFVVGVVTGYRFRGPLGKVSDTVEKVKDATK